MSTILVNGLPAVSVRLLHPWQGVWTAEVDFDLALVPVVPSGKVVLTIGTTTLAGTIDPDASGAFGEKARARIIGGGGAWHREVQALHFHNDAGVTTSAVVTATAAEIGEAAVVVLPELLGVDYMRTAGPASRVLAGRDWYVTLAGITTIGPRAPLPANPLEIDVLSWDAHEQRAEIATDTVLVPGTILIDPRFGTTTVRDVEQTFDGNGARASARCGADAPATGKLAGALAAAVRELGGLATLKNYRYRVVLQGIDGRLTLQAVNAKAGAPDAVSIPPWYGVPGVKSLVQPGTECAVVFLDGDPAQPVVVSFFGGDELSTGVATQASQAGVVAAMTALNTALAALLNPVNAPALLLDPSGVLTGAVATAATALTSAITNPAAYSLKTKAP